MNTYNAYIIMEATIVIIMTVSICLFNKYIRPWLEQNNLMHAAQIAVAAAEAMYGRYNGKEKLNEALAQLRNKGFDIDADDVIHAVQAAWQKLNTSQIAAGEKEAIVKVLVEDETEE